MYSTYRHRGWAWRVVFGWMALGLMVFLFAACAVPRTEKRVERRRSVETGLASWYGKPFHGRLTANGEVYDMYKISAAHKTLPLGSTVRVTNRNNGKSIVVRVNDRGPFVKGRIIDMSYGGAKALGMVAEGVVPVRVETLTLGDNRYYKSGRKSGSKSARVKTAAKAAPMRYTVQAGSFQDRANALQLKLDLERRLADETVFIREWNDRAQTYYRVRVGSFSTEDDARALSQRLEAANYNVFVTAD